MLMINDSELMNTKGKSASLLTYLALVAGAAAIIKILTSSRGRLTIPGMTFSWG